MSEYEILSEEQIAQALEGLPNWHARDSKLTAIYTFPDFKAAFAFMTLVAQEAEKRGHHPEWSNVYNVVTIFFSTHDAGNVITTLDVQMAKFASKEAQKIIGSD